MKKTFIHRFILSALKTLMSLSIVFICLIYILKSFLSPSNLSSIIFNDEPYIITSTAYQDLPQYINEQEFKEVYSSFAIDYIKYNLGIITEVPQPTSLVNILNKYCDEYEKATNEVIDRQIITNNINDIVSSMQTSFYIENNLIHKLLIFIYNDSSLFIFIIILLISLILLTVMERSIKIFYDIALLFFPNAFILYVFAFIISMMFKNSLNIPAIALSLSTSLKDILITTGTINLVIFISLFIVYFVLKRLTSNEK